MGPSLSLWLTIILFKIIGLFRLVSPALPIIVQIEIILLISMCVRNEGIFQITMVLDWMI